MISCLSDSLKIGFGLTAADTKVAPSHGTPPGGSATPRCSIPMAIASTSSRPWRTEPASPRPSARTRGSDAADPHNPKSLRRGPAKVPAGEASVLGILAQCVPEWCTRSRRSPAFVCAACAPTSPELGRPVALALRSGRVGAPSSPTAPPGRQAAQRARDRAGKRCSLRTVSEYTSLSWSPERCESRDLSRVDRQSGSGAVCIRAWGGMYERGQKLSPSLVDSRSADS